MHLFHCSPSKSNPSVFLAAPAPIRTPPTPALQTHVREWPELADARTLASHGWHACRWRDNVFRSTPLMRSRWLSEMAGVDVWLKLESEQVTGAFKARGAAHRILSPLVDDDPRHVPNRHQASPLLSAPSHVRRAVSGGTSRTLTRLMARLRSPDRAARRFRRW